MIDISVLVEPGVTPQWPGSPRLRFDRTRSIANGDSVDDTTIVMNLHIGTHIDAPSHFLADAKTVDEVPLDILIGACHVVSLPEVAKVHAADLDAANIPANTSRLLIKTNNAKRWSAEFDEAFVGLSVDAAHWIVDRGIRLVGVDYLSVQPYGDSDEVHHTLLGAEVVIVEGLNLAEADPGAYVLVCLPLKLRGTEGAPARAILLPSGTPLGDVSVAPAVQVTR